MMLRKKLISIYIKQVLLVGAVLFGLAISVFIWMFNKYDEIEMKQDFAPSGITKFINDATIDEHGQLIVSSNLLEQLKSDGGWIQSLDETGQVIQSFYVPDDVPKQYNPALLIDYWLQIKPFPYSLMMWIQHKDDYTFTLLYGKNPQQQNVIAQIIDKAQFINETIKFPDQTTNELIEKNIWLQVFDHTGMEITSWNKPLNAANSYTLQDLALRNKVNAHSGTVIESYYDEKNGFSWIMQYPITNNLHTFSLFPSLAPELELMLVSVAFLLLASIVILTLLAIIYANRFMRPIVDIMTNIALLGHGDELIIAPKKNEKKEKRKLFYEVFDSIYAVHHKIVQSKEIEKQTQQKREEWIAGITHDMKTPLSSIKGYAHMLATDKYEWSQDDIRKFAAIMLNKTEYMNQLLEDLSLTYRLSNQHLPVQLTTHNIAEVLYDAVDLINKNRLFEQAYIELRMTEDEIFANIHPPWIERIVYNLVANAVLHNKEGTKVNISLYKLNDTWTIEFSDNGYGMDEKTVARLFDRYYRGTNTEQHTDGTGLGMAITSQLVQAMQGTIEVDSQLGQGTVVKLRWNSEA